MVTAFSLNGNAPESRSPYLTPGAMAQDAQENLQVPWSTVVLPTIGKIQKI